MISIPTPIPRLCLTYEFDRSVVEPSQQATTATGVTTTTNQTNHHPSTQIHDDIIKTAAHTLDTMIGFTQYGVTTNAFSAKVIDSTSIDTINMAHNLPFDPNFHVATTTRGPAIRYEFIYNNKMSTDGITIVSSKLFLRIVTTFGQLEETIDGVTASRIGFMAMELLEGHNVHTTIFPKLQPIQPNTIRQRFNFIYYNEWKGKWAIPWGYMVMLVYRTLERWGLKSITDITRVNDIPSMLRFHSSVYAMEPARYQLYTSDHTKAFKSFLSIAEQWTKRLGLDGFFYLLNFAPFAAPAVTRNIWNIIDVQKRYDGVFAPAGSPPGKEIWDIMNYSIASKIVINNYGNHQHNFTKVKPVAFIWDWLHIRNSLHVAACITINGTFLSCFRGLSSSFNSLVITNDIFTDPVQKAITNVSYTKTIG